jgi:hypothetical protein
MIHEGNVIRQVEAALALARGSQRACSLRRKGPRHRPKERAVGGRMRVTGVVTEKIAKLQVVVAHYEGAPTVVRIVVLEVFELSGQPDELRLDVLVIQKTSTVTITS